MLVLSRKPKESVFINGNVVVTVLGIQGNRVRLGIEAPREMPVHRQEVYDAIQREMRTGQPTGRPPRAERVGRGGAKAQSDTK